MEANNDLLLHLSQKVESVDSRRLKMDPQPDRPSHFFREHLPLQRINGAPSGTDASVESRLCPRCEAAVLWIRENLDSFRQMSREGSDPQRPCFEHHASGQALENSYKSGCHFCTLVWIHLTEDRQELTRELYARLTEPQGLIHARQRQRLEKAADEIRHMGSVVLEPKPLRQSDGQEVLTRLSVVGRTETWHDSSLLVFAEPGELSHINPTRWPISTCSPTALALAKSWVDGCAATHDTCNRETAPGLPTRLLQLNTSPDHTVRLVETSDIPGSEDKRYAALSYCWGGSVTPKLTSASYPSFTTTGVPLSELPATIYDAITTAKSLKIKWLWVDSLCIIQDSSEDWSAELAKMTQVYQNCDICIAARGAQSSNDGLFCRRDPLRFAPCQLFKMDKGVQVSLLSPYFTSSLLCAINWPLETRGWVVQERILPRRTLKFGSHLSFECRKGTFEEFFPGAGRVELGFWTNQLFDLLDGEPDASMVESSTESDADRNRKVYELWKKILRFYSSTALTLRSDRLAAISGVIGLITGATSLCNRAGLWEEFLAEELLWRSFSSDYRPTGIGPSWSWVAWECEVDSHAVQYSPATLVDQVRPLTSGLRFCTSTERNDYGLTNECDVAIQMNYFPLRGELIQPVKSDHRWNRDFLPDTTLPATPICCILDSQITDQEWERITLIPLLLVRAHNEHEIHGLVVKPSTRFARTFERAGIFRWEFPDTDLHLVESYISTTTYTSIVLT